MRTLIKAFRNLAAWTDERARRRAARRVETGCFDLSRDDDYLDVLYRVVLGREPDPDGKGHYLAALRSGAMRRPDVFQAFTASEEFRRRFLTYPSPYVLTDFRPICSNQAFLPYVERPPYDACRLNELVNPRRWLEPEWLARLLDLRVVPPTLDQLHRKGFEWTQTVYGLEKLGKLGEGVRCLGVGSGHEPLVYWLANHAGEVIATDLYEGVWSRQGDREGDPTVLDDPGRYAPFAYRRDRLRFLRMDGRRLEFPDADMDVVFSISSIEHFGGHTGSADSMREIGRVLKPGGVAAIATEMVINDRRHPEYFRPEELVEYLVAPSGLRLVQAPVFELPAYAVEHPSRMPQDLHRTPHLVLDDGGVHYTSVMLFFRKPA
jgi:SAM-dependent methyltransferase